jgi:hypothetical protein
MPNWCENRLSIAGPKEDISNIFEKIKNQDPDGKNQTYQIFENLYPTPPELNIGDAPVGSANWTEQQKSNLKKFGYTDWYDWRNDKWGTKWGDCETHLAQDIFTNSDGISTVAFYFDSAWAPPIEGFHKIASDYPNLLFCLYYQETGMGFCGRNVWANGECVEEDSADLITDYFDEDYLYNEYITKGENNE